MSGFLFAFLSVLVAGLGARDQVSVAALSSRQGQRPGLLLAAIAVSAGTAAFAAWAATFSAPLLNANARLFVVALALGFGGGEALLLRPSRQPAEPTHSLFAAAFVLVAHQAADAARFLIFAIALGTAAPLAAGLGGAAGGAAGAAVAWLAPEFVLNPRLRRLRLWLGGAMLLLAAMVAARSLGRF